MPSARTPKWLAPQGLRGPWAQIAGEMPSWGSAIQGRDGESIEHEDDDADDRGKATTKRMLEQDQEGDKD